MMKFFKKKLLTINWNLGKKLLFYAVATLAWNGSFRIHELLSKEARAFDPTVTLLWRDLKIEKVKIDDKQIGVVSVFLKSPKSDRIGAGQRVEVFETGNFMCPYKALNKYIASLPMKIKGDQPVFRDETGECFTGRKLSKCLEEISAELKC